MRTLSGITAVTICAVLAAVGCDALSIGLTGDCDYMLTCAHHDWLDGEAGGPPNPACGGDPTQDASAVSDECAVFASASAEAGGDGTTAKPYASLTDAVANAKGKRVLACASGAFAESVRVEAGIEVIGGFDCDAGWTWSEEARSTIEGRAGAAALTLTETASGAKVRSFAIHAANAKDATAEAHATEAGRSSIGVVVADIEAELAQIDVIARDGVDGANGETPTEAPQAGANGVAMSASTACVVAVFGGDPGVSTCEDGETRGGVGGLGGTPGTDEGNGYKGADGEPLLEPNSEEYGLGGVGQTDPDGDCKPGTIGKSGARGAAGFPGSGTVLTLAGIAGGDGTNGKTGTRGQGGGGGGGTKAGQFCGPSTNRVDGPGASGGGGGAGGCGGKGGGGGLAGGSSIGIVSLGTKLVLTDVTVEVGTAGKGGSGVAGQSGADGGAGAAGGAGSGVSPSIRGCKGGDGGTGGAGGPGGGGRGGHAAGIVYAAAPSAAIMLKDFKPGTAGDGGITPGENAVSAGKSGVCWSFGERESKSCGE